MRHNKLEKYTDDDSVYTAVLEALGEKFPQRLAKSTGIAGGVPLSARLLVIEVAYETNAQILLPALYYGLCNDTVEAILSARNDLPQHILTTYSRGKEKFAVQIPEFVEDVIMNFDRNCDACDSAWESLRKEADSLIRSGARCMTVDPLDTLDEMSVYFDDTCEDCKLEFRANIEKWSQKIWSLLPEFFGLTSWEHLRGGPASMHKS